MGSALQLPKVRWWRLDLSSLISGIYKQGLYLARRKTAQIGSFSPIEGAFCPCFDSLSSAWGAVYFDFRGPSFTAVETVPSAL
jgi:hypothetical protein